MPNLVQQLGQHLENALEVYWDRTLTLSEENPFPLAPSDKVESGEVNAESYLEQNKLLTNVSNEIMVLELNHIVKESGFAAGPTGIEVLGAGLLRDLLWLCHACISEFSPISIRDSSVVACANALNFLEEHSLSDIRLDHVEIESAWKNAQIDDLETILYYAGQFIQNQDQKAKDRIMKHFGKFLKIPNNEGVLCRRVYLLHPFVEDNPLTRVVWRNTTPYSREELLTPLEKGFGGKVEMEIIGQHNYFHQLYSFVRLSGSTFK